MKQVATMKPESPRGIFIAKCISEGIKPIPHTIIRDKYITELSLCDQRLGDVVVGFLAGMCYCYYYCYYYYFYYY